MNLIPGTKIQSHTVEIGKRSLVGRVHFATFNDTTVVALLNNTQDWKVDNSNFISHLGVITNPQGNWTLLEYLTSNLTQYRLLHHKIETSLVYKIALVVAKALEYLHSLGRAHMHLSSDYIWLNHDATIVKLSIWDYSFRRSEENAESWQNFDSMNLSHSQSFDGAGQISNESSSNGGIREEIQRKLMEKDVHDYGILLKTLV